MTKKKYFIITLAVIILVTTIITTSISYINGYGGYFANQKIIREGVSYSNKSQFNYGLNKDEAKLSLLFRAGLINNYAIAGSLYAKNDVSNILNENINSTEELPDILEFLNDSKTLVEKGFEEPTCKNLLGISVINNDLDNLKRIGDKSNLKNSFDCSLVLAIKKNKKDFYTYLYNKKNIRLSEKDTASLLDQCYTALGILNITPEFEPNIIKCNNEELLNIFIDKMDKKQKSEFLLKAIKDNNNTAAKLLIKKDADYDQRLQKSTVDKESRQLLEIAMIEKKDEVTDAILEKMTNYPNTLDYFDFVKNERIVVPTFEYFVANNMPNSAIRLIGKGYNISKTYRPEKDKALELPLIFAVIGNSYNHEVFDRMIKKENLISRLTETQKEQVLAYAIDVFSNNPDQNQLKIIKNLIDQNLNINSELAYKSSGIYEKQNYPIWALPYFKNIDINPSDVIEKRRVITSEYFELIKTKNPKIDFVVPSPNGNYRLIYGAGTARNTNFVEYLINKGVKIDDIIRDNDTNTIIHKAISNNDYETLKMLINYKPNLNLVTSNKETYLTYTLKAKNLDKKVAIIKLLLENGADQKLCPVVGSCPIDLIQTSDYKAELELLIKN